MQYVAKSVEYRLFTLYTQCGVDFVKVYYVLCFGFWVLRQLKLSLVTSIFHEFV